MTIDAVLQHPPLPVTSGEAESISQGVYGIVGTATRLSGERDANFRITSGGAAYALKILHPDERASVVEMQVLALGHLAATDPTLPVPRPIRTVHGDLVGRLDISTRPTAVSMATFLPGTPIPLGQPTPERIDSLTGTLARLHHALDGFAHEEDRRESVWDLTQAHRLRAYTDALPADRATLVAEWIDSFETDIGPTVAELPAQLIHSDFNQLNLLVDPVDDTTITGIIDFGDACRAPRVVDVAIAAAYATLAGPDPVSTVAAMMGAYHRCHPLSPDEIAVAADLVIGRLVQSYTIGLWRSRLHPDNRDYILIHSQPVRTALDTLAGDLRTLRTRIEDACT